MVTHPLRRQPGLVSVLRMSYARAVKDRSDLRSRYGRWALVTGAAHGLGQALARSLARRHFDQVLVDVDRPALERLAAELSREQQTENEVVCLDVRSAELPARAQALAEAYEIGLLINNVGVSTIGSFLDTELSEHLRVLHTNCQPVLVLTHILGRAMAARHRGGIVVISSGSALTGMPRVTHYAATKAYGLQLAAGLWAELESAGVDVLASCPGLIHTRGTEQHPPQVQDAPMVEMRPAADVAEEIIEALDRRAGPVVLPGLRHRLSLEAVVRMLPRRTALRWLGQTMHKLYPPG